MHKCDIFSCEVNVLLLIDLCYAALTKIYEKQIGVGMWKTKAEVKAVFESFKTRKTPNKVSIRPEILRK